MTTRASLAYGLGPAFLAPMIVGSLVLVACGGDEAKSGDEDNIAETTEILGNDRVGDKLRGHLDQVPSSYAEFEKLFAIGRECARDDSKEVFVVEESQTRAGGEQAATDDLMPRAVVTGCNMDRENPDSVINSFGLMVALFSSPDAPNASKGDPMILSPVEAMSLDKTTGLYNFYVFESNGEGKPGTINRIRRMPDDTVVKYRLEPGTSSVATLDVPDRACNNCHANMGPLMNELTEPWTNWVSTHKQLPATKLKGETLSIVNEAVPGSDDRSGFANDLEPIMRAAMRVWVDGVPDSPGSGFGQAAIEGDQPQKLEGLMKSVFCDTELNYVSAFETVPMELFIDPSAVAGAGFQPPGSYPQDVFPVQMPVRSEMDKRIEKFLMKKKYLAVRTVSAIRLIDDVMDAFSKPRCSLYDKVKDGLPTEPADVDAHVRKILLAKIGGSDFPAGARASYMKVLLDPAATTDAVKQAQTAYVAEVSARYQKDAELLDTADGRAKLKERVDARKAAAKKLFPGDKNPLPVLDADGDSGAGGAGGGSGSGGAGGAGAGGGSSGCAHSECTDGDKLDPACSPCATEVCDTDSFCCENSYDTTCVGIAQGIAACGC